MRDRHRDDLQELLERLLGEAEAQAASEDVRAGERMLELYAAPEPDAHTLAQIRRHMMLTFRLGRRRRRAFYRSLTAAAAIVVVVLIALFGRRPAGPTPMAQAGIIPAAIWESDDVAGDDLEIAYFDAEIQQIETQLRRLEAGESDTDSDRLETIEMELMQIDTVFWKE